MRKARFKKIVEQHKDRIYSHALYFLGNRPDAEDVTQEVLIRTWKNLDSIYLKTTQAWLMRVTHNLCIDYARRRKSGVTIVQHDDLSILDTKAAFSGNGTDPHKDAENSDLRRQIYTALQKLPEHLRSVIMMREINDIKYEEISQALDIPLNSVKVYIHRGRNELKKALDKSIAKEIGYVQ